MGTGRACRVDEWRDESAWKTRFMHLFPKAVYVEVENYFVKALIGWTGVLLS